MDGLIEFAKKQCVIFPDDSEMGKYLRETLRILQESPCEDAVSRKKLEKLKRWRFSYDTNTTIPKSDLFVRLTDIRDLPPVKPTQRWIPVSERLPEENTSYLVTVKQGYIMIAIWCGNPKYWRNVIAWMPLSKPYKSKGDVRQC